VIVSSAQADRLRRQIDELAATWAVPGGVVVAATGNDIIFEHAFGFADVDRGVLVSPTHLFEIGSISKIFTAAVIVQLAEEGVLRLDQPIGEVLDWLPPALTGSELTIERLLQHSAGLISGVDAVPDQVAQVASFVGGVSSAEPGSWFHYSNLGYILLGLAAEQTGGVTLAESVRERILKPLGMLDTIATVANADYDLLARGYRARCDDRPWLPGDPQILAHLLEVDGAESADGCIEVESLCARDDDLSARPRGRRGRELAGSPRHAMESLRPRNQHGVNRGTARAEPRGRNGGICLVPPG
jgi:D-alanyl-D-alanine carboxypeptidase